MTKLGFGLMRLPTSNPADWGEIDKEEMRVMVDKFLSSGFSYFDTAYVYHKGNSERAFGELVAARYPRGSYTIATKMPVFLVKTAPDYQRIFDEQMSRCRVDYFDYYFLHAIGRSTYPDICKLGGFEFLAKMKEQGRVRHIGFSYHDDAETLDMLLTEHPETEIVQLQINYVDWEDM